MLHPTVYNTSQVCHQLGVAHVVLSPGSRNAPLTISFARNKKIKKWVIPDERVAGFVALGIAQQTKTPVAICCTSGTALLNYAPAIAEAFYREIPLIVISADRPPHLIDQRDGQTIRQFEALKNHVKASFQLPIITSDKNAKTFENQLIEAIQLSQLLPKAPIHLNIPFDEPFYPTKRQKLSFKKIEFQTKQQEPSPTPEIELENYSKVLILVGQNDTDKNLSKELKKHAKKIPVLQSPLNNLHVGGINHVDAFIKDQPELQPELLITAGLSVLSKNLKNYLRKFKPKKHLHFDEAGVEVDTFQTHPTLIQQSLNDFLKTSDFQNADKNYLKDWKKHSKTTENAIVNFLFDESTFTETTAFYFASRFIPDHSILHLSNSMPVRFADLFSVKPTLEVFSNRGTSGIDGCTSTALGTALISNKLNVLLTGDLSFLYDRNAFFHSHIPNNLRVLVFNNQGGGIFRLINSPASLPELETYFETRHNRTAEYICKENNLTYYQVRTFSELENSLVSFYGEGEQAKVLEIFTEPTKNEKIYNSLKTYIYEHNTQMGNH